jgi:hypothetical protein
MVTSEVSVVETSAAAPANVLAIDAPEPHAAWTGAFPPPQVPAPHVHGDSVHSFHPSAPSSVDGGAGVPGHTGGGGGSGGGIAAGAARGIAAADTETTTRHMTQLLEKLAHSVEKIERVQDDMRMRQEADKAEVMAAIESARCRCSTTSG